MVGRFFAVWLGFGLLLSAGVAFGRADLTFDRVFTPVPPWGAQPSRIVWAPDERSFLYVPTTQNSEHPSAVWQYEIRAGRARIAIDPARYGPKSRTPAVVGWSPDAARFAFIVNGTLYVRDVATNLDRIVAHDAGDALWSPKGDAIAYTRNADLYVAMLQPKLHAIRLTIGGIPGALLNGDLDWVYPEELGIEHGFAWAPDGKSLAYLSMDERHVTSFPIVDFLAGDNKVTYQRYPLAGEKNPAVALHLVSIAGGVASTVYDARPRDEYIPAFAWKPNSHALLVEVLDRAQKRVRVFSWERGTRTDLLDQRDPKWVDAVPMPVWIGRTSLWVLERDNAAGLYLRSSTGSFRRLTGRYRADAVLAVDSKRGAAFITAAYPTRRDRALLEIPLGGGNPVNLTPAAGAHAVSLSPSGRLFVDTHSTLNDPPQTDLVDAATRGVRATLAAEKMELAAELLPTQMLSVDSRFGKLDATMLLPPKFDASHKYPVIVYVYGGPELPVTANVFGNVRGLYHQMLARSGFIVFSIDGPASQIDDEAHVRLLYHNFGPASLAGQEIGAAYLRSLPYVDPTRIGIWGWSFGGYETAYALTHSTSFKAGAAGAPVTDWHLYDSIYTERYMGSPKDDAKAYERSSVVDGAPRLNGALMINHGTSDDNVHMANTVTLLQAFIAARKTHVDLMAYPRQRHGFAALADQRQLYERMLEWWQAHL